MLDLIMNINLLGGYVIEWNHAHSNVVSKTLHHQVIIDFLSKYYVVFTDINVFKLGSSVCKSYDNPA